MFLILISVIIFVYGFYALYLIYCTLRLAQKSGRLALVPWYVRWVAWSYLIVGYTCDLVFNLTIGAIIFRETPWDHGLLFTARCSSHRQDGDWRQSVAEWVCNGWLNPFDVGHC